MTLATKEGQKSFEEWLMCNYGYTMEQVNALSDEEYYILEDAWYAEQEQ